MRFRPGPPGTNHFFSWKYFAHSLTVGQRPRYPSQKATNADSWVMALAGKWCGCRRNLLRKSQKNELAGSPNPRSKCATKTTRSPAAGFGSISPVGRLHSMPAEIRRVLLSHSISAEETSEPSHPARSFSSASLSQECADIMTGVAKIRCTEANLVRGNKETACRGINYLGTEITCG